MGDKEFKQLVDGSLHSPSVTLYTLRLRGALNSVVVATGTKGAEALRAYVRQVQADTKRAEKEGK